MDRSQIIEETEEERKTDRKDDVWERERRERDKLALGEKKRK